ncbi:MAG: sigma-70 family RNA polymerase sigma factor [Verrucomicrobiota bacterium]
MTEPIHFETFMRNYQNMVFSTAVRLLGNDAEAQDIAQDVFLKAYERFAELSQSPTVGGWLKTVTTNLCLNHLSRYRARWRFFSEMLSREDEDEVSVDIPAPEVTSDKLTEADHRRLIEQALQKLPVAQRVPLVLFHFENLTYEEIAAKLRISLSKVKTDIFRGREALRKKLSLASTGTDEWSDFKPPTPAREAADGLRRTDRLRNPQTLLGLGLAST